MGYYRLLVYIQATASRVDYFYQYLPPVLSCQQEGGQLIKRHYPACFPTYRERQFVVPADRQFRLLLGLTAPMINELLSPAGAYLFSYFVVPAASGHGGLL
jgi:hypothetical protein